MSKKRKVEGKVELSFTVEPLADGRVRVEMRTTDGSTLHLNDLINAAQYILWLAARGIGLEFDEALAQLCEGAKEYRPAVYLVESSAEKTPCEEASCEDENTDGLPNAT